MDSCNNSIVCVSTCKLPCLFLSPVFSKFTFINEHRLELMLDFGAVFSSLLSQDDLNIKIVSSKLLALMESLGRLQIMASCNRI